MLVKDICVSFRLSQRSKRLLEAAAAREHRSLTNMLETLLFAHCDKHGINVADGLADGTGESKGSTTK
jgi:hypothetical protein